jgi:hypothetical protein
MTNREKPEPYAVTRIVDVNPDGEPVYFWPPDHYDTPAAAIDRAAILAEDGSDVAIFVSHGRRMQRFIYRKQAAAQ